MFYPPELELIFKTKSSFNLKFDVSFMLVSDVFTGCSSSVERSVWDREVGGPIPLTPTLLFLT